MHTAAAFFAAKIAHETDPADLAAARATGTGPVVVDVRSQAAWDQGHLPGAVHLPDVSRAAEVLPDRHADLVVHCWGPGCNGATKAALALTEQGWTRVRELVGGYEYWVREGFAVITPTGRRRRSPDPLTAPPPG